MSISPKLSNSTPSMEYADWSRRHEQTRHAPEVIRRLIRTWTYQLKFVVDSIAACQEVERYLQQFPETDRSRIMLMPEGTDQAILAERAAWLIPYLRRTGAPLLSSPANRMVWPESAEPNLWKRSVAIDLGGRAFPCSAKVFVASQSAG